MDAKEAVSHAKAYVSELFADEGISNLGLEEVAHSADYWDVTLSFTRSWQQPLMPLLKDIAPRSRKVVRVSAKTGHVEWVKEWPQLESA